MKLFTHCAHREMEEERVTYRMLLEAAMLRTRMEELPRLLQDDPAILDRVMSECRGMDNPLHVGALHGNVNFVREILNKRPELSRELNPEGQSPLHLASARGHVDVVREILRIDADACFIRDRDGMIPLHLAAINGRLEVLKELVIAENITTFILTRSGEPILHLCANNKKFEALEMLIKLFINVPDFLNLKDRDDNTILHLLAAKRNYGVMKILLETSDQVDVNAKNMDGFTPLQVSLQQNENPLPEFRIRRLLTKAGAERYGNYSLFMGLIMKLKIPGSDESGFGEALMVVAILMATLAFQARLTPPGGVWQDTTFNNATLPNVTQSSPPPNLAAHYVGKSESSPPPNLAPHCAGKSESSPPPNLAPHHAGKSESSPPPNLAPHYAGKSVMSYVDPSRYKRFSVWNDITFIFSLIVIQLLLASYLFKSRDLKIVAVIITSGSLVTMSFTYDYSATYISLDKQYLLTVVLISSVFLYVCTGYWTMRNLWQAAQHK